jgi:DNA-directed RNA polymerase specialized sigma24 family protein
VDEREALLLRFFQGLEQAEIARRMESRSPIC